MLYTVMQICERYGVCEGTVLGWIRSGELRAMNIGAKLGKRKPRWRITEEALVAFEELRTLTPKLPRTNAKKKQTSNALPFYPVRG